MTEIAGLLIGVVAGAIVFLAVCFLSGVAGAAFLQLRGLRGTGPLDEPHAREIWSACLLARTGLWWIGALLGLVTWWLLPTPFSIGVALVFAIAGACVHRVGVLRMRDSRRHGGFGPKGA